MIRRASSENAWPLAKCSSAVAALPRASAAAPWPISTLARPSRLIAEVGMLGAPELLDEAAGAGAAGVGLRVMGLIGMDGHEAFEDGGHIGVFAAESLLGRDEGLVRIGLRRGPAARCPSDRGGRGQVQSQDRGVFGQGLQADGHGLIDVLLCDVNLAEGGLEHRQVVPGGDEVRVAPTQRRVGPLAAGVVEEFPGGGVIAGAAANRTRTPRLLAAAASPAVPLPSFFQSLALSRASISALSKSPRFRAMRAWRCRQAASAPAAAGGPSRHSLAAIVHAAARPGRIGWPEQGHGPLAPQQRIVLLLRNRLVVGPRRVGKAASYIASWASSRPLSSGSPPATAGAVQQLPRLLESAAAPTPARPIAAGRMIGDHGGQLPRRHQRRLPHGDVRLGQDQHRGHDILGQRDARVLHHQRLHADRPGLSDQATPTARKFPRAPSDRSRTRPIPGSRTVRWRYLGTRAELLAEVGLLGQPVALHQDLRRLGLPGRRQEEQARQRGRSQSQELFLPPKQFAGARAGGSPAERCRPHRRSGPRRPAPAR